MTDYATTEASQDENDLLALCRKIVCLLEDPQRGLHTWHEAKRDRIADLVDLLRVEETDVTPVPGKVKTMLETHTRLTGCKSGKPVLLEMSKVSRLPGFSICELAAEKDEDFEVGERTRISWLGGPTYLVSETIAEIAEGK